ncbi:MAG: hypothetical protein ACLRWF_10515 [Ruthenibacterium sp.]
MARGLGVSFLYAPVAESELAAGTLARFELAQVPMSGAFYLVCLKTFCRRLAAGWNDAQAH